MDQPREGSTKEARFKVEGWAGDDVGIRAVRVLLDDQPVALASFIFDRPDVTAVYPELRHGTDRHGYEAVVDEAPPGPHTVSVEAVDTDGATTKLGTSRVLIVAGRTAQPGAGGRMP